ncbi:hypothetical protein VMB_35220 [Vibrio mimicus VM603]|uniref:Uncharacterized protein n=1 Tax=Vibrio mimicus VM603 TaxID=671074 RepID=D2YJ25_VIBMI|nr:hypothetical protein VMB_35220 [Vibrio mimicus VM603]
MCNLIGLNFLVIGAHLLCSLLIFGAGQNAEMQHLWICFTVKKIHIKMLNWDAQVCFELKTNAYQFVHKVRSIISVNY